MKFHIDFINYKQERKTFSFDLFDRRYVRVFKEVNEKWKNSRPSKLPEYNAKWFLPTSQEDFLERIYEIKKHVETIDSLGVVEIGSSKINENITREELNRLHEEFHKYIEIKPKPPADSAEAQVARLCHKLNDLVHLTDGALDNKSRNNPESRLIATALEHSHLPYEEEDYQFKEAVRRKGTLYVGYATPGKNLHHCFQDNDMSVVKQGLVRPSQGISCEIHFEISGQPNITEQTEINVIENFEIWCEANNVLSYGYDFTLPIHRPGWMPLGTITGGIEEFQSFINNKEAVIADFRFEGF